MGKRIIFVITLLTALLLLSACALTDEAVQLNYQPNFRGISKIHGEHALTVGKFSNIRGVDPRLLSRKINLNQEETTGKYLAEKPVAAILRQAVIDSLKFAGYRVTENGKYILSAQLVDLQNKWYPGWFSSELRTNIQVEFSLVDARTGSQIWDQTFNGSAACQSGTDSAPYRTNFSKATNNLIFNLLNSPEFKKISK